MMINAVKSTLELLAWHVGQGEKPVAGDLHAEESRDLDPGILRQRGQQVFGGAGYLRGRQGRAQSIARPRVMSIGGGSVEIMKDLAARQMGL